MSTRKDAAAPHTRDSDAAIEAHGLRKSYGALEAVRGIDLRVACGEVFALLGPNGAGKTTIVEILEGHRVRSAGQVTVLGHDPAAGERAFKERIGIVLQSAGVDPFLSVEETLNLFRGYYPSPLPLDDLLDAVGLRGKRRERVRRLSGGQQRRLDVAIGLAGDPELLFLDEPTTGFDPSARREAWEMVEGLKERGKTILLTTHYMEEAEYLADRVAIMARGRIVAEGAPSELTQRQAATTVRFRLSGEAPAPPGGLTAPLQANGGAYALTTAEPTRDLHLLTAWAVEQGVELENLSVSRPSLEEVFIGLTDGLDAEEAEA